MKRWLILALLYLLTACKAPPQPPGNLVKVERVVSGQTLEVADGLGNQVLVQRVRLIGIEAPDLKQQPWGTAAQEQLQRLIGNDPIRLESDQEATDQFERRLAYAWKGESLLNEILVKEGYAIFVPRSPNNKYDQRLANAQEYARIMGLGVWNPDRPMRLTPGEFRRQFR